jgi:hypothetical protein
MTPMQFCCWLRGYLQLAGITAEGPCTLAEFNQRQVREIEYELKKVFPEYRNKTPPEFKLDPEASMKLDRLKSKP